MEYDETAATTVVWLRSVSFAHDQKRNVEQSLFRMQENPSCIWWHKEWGKCQRQTAASIPFFISPNHNGWLLPTKTAAIKHNFFSFNFFFFFKFVRSKNPVTVKQTKNNNNTDRIHQSQKLAKNSPLTDRHTKQCVTDCFACYWFTPRKPPFWELRYKCRPGSLEPIPTVVAGAVKQREGERQAGAGKAAEGERERWTGCDACGAVGDVGSAEPGQARTIPLFWSMVESRAVLGWWWWSSWWERKASAMLPPSCPLDVSLVSLWG